MLCSPVRALFPASLGDEVAKWVERHCVHGPGDVYGQPVRLTGEEHRFLEAVYAIDRQTGRRLVDQATYSRRKGTRKSELGAWVVLAETRAPCRAYLDGGEPVARAPSDPWVLCAATTEDQSELVYGAFRAIVKASPTLEPLYDVGLEVTYLRDGPGQVALTQTGNPAALDGARPTFEVADETHLWVGRLHEAYAVLRQNLRKRRESQPWLLAATTMYAEGEGSVAEAHHEHGLLVAAGKVPSARMVYDHRQAGEFDLDDPVQLRAAIVDAGGDAHWSDTDAIAAEYHDPQVSEARFRRYWLNQPWGSEDRWMPAAAWAAAARPGATVAAGEAVTLGFDGSLGTGDPRRVADSTVLMGCRLSDGLLFPVGLWEAPGPGPWEPPRDEVDRAVAEAHRAWRVVRAYADPPHWQTEVGVWAQRFGEDVWLEWWTNRDTPMAAALDRLLTDVRAGTATHDGDARVTRHVLNAHPLVKRAAVSDPDGRRERVLVRKAHANSPDKIDATVAAALAYEARADALAAGLGKPPRRYRAAGF